MRAGLRYEPPHRRHPTAFYTPGLLEPGQPCCPTQGNPHTGTTNMSHVLLPLSLQLNPMQALDKAHDTLHAPIVTLPASHTCRRPAGTQAPTQLSPSCFCLCTPSSSRRGHGSAWCTCRNQKYAEAARVPQRGVTGLTARRKILCTEGRHRANAYRHIGSHSPCTPKNDDHHILVALTFDF